MLFEIVVSVLVAADGLLFLLIAAGMLFSSPYLPNVWTVYARIFKCFYYARDEESCAWELRHEDDLRKDVTFKSMGHRMLAVAVLRLGTSFFFTCDMMVVCACTFVFDFVFMLDMVSHGEVHMKTVTRAGLDYLVSNLVLLIIYVAAKSPACH